MWLLLVLMSCDVGTADTADTANCLAGPELTWANFGDGFFRTWCRSCHSETSPNRFEAPVGVDFDTLDDVVRWEGSIRSTVLEEQSMPLGGGLGDEDLEELAHFLRCGLPGE